VYTHRASDLDLGAKMANSGPSGSFHTSDTPLREQASAAMGRVSRFKKVKKVLDPDERESARAKTSGCAR